MSSLTMLQTATTTCDDQPERILQELIRNGLVRRVLEEVESDAALLDQLTKHSYWHSTGIFKLVLWKPQGNTPEVRIHIWSQRSRDFSATHVDSIHNHRWDFASQILTGSFVKELFITESTDNNDHQQFRFESQGRGQPNRITHVGDVSIKTSFKTTIDRGRNYFLNSRTLHRITPSTNDTSATLFVSSPNQFTFSDVLFSPGSRRQEGHQPPATKLKPELIVSLLADLRNQIIGS